MGFCGRCGEPVSGTRCTRCGGSSVAPVVQWKPSAADESDKQDQWSRTYTRERSPVRTSPAVTPASHMSSGPSIQPNRFPRPKGHSSSLSQPVNSRVAAHIEATTAARPLPQQNSFYANSSASLSSSDIFRDPETMELSKVYGSVLQPKETLASFCCRICSFAFSPDATIYPDPSSPSDGYLCKPCFTKNGGSKGDCYACHRPVLILKREGGFVEATNRVYHKACFDCEGCAKNIGDRPMVDLEGRPCCAQCFDTSLSRSSSAPRAVIRTPTKGNLGGMQASSRSREGSPALDELEQRLGIPRKRADSAASVGTAGRSRAETSSESPRPFMSSRSTTMDVTASPVSSPSRASEDAVEAMKRRFLRTPTGSPYTTPTKNTTGSSSVTSPPSAKYDMPELKTRRSLASLRAASTGLSGSSSTSEVLSATPVVHAPTPERIILAPSTRLERGLGDMESATSTLRRHAPISSPPDLISDSYETATESSGLTTPPRATPLRSAHNHGMSPLPSLTDHVAKLSNQKPTGGPETRKIFHSKRSLENLRIPAPLSPESKCSRCALPLFTTSGGKFVSVPEEPASTAAPKVYHSDCFTCAMCDRAFAAGEQGRAVFVRTSEGPCHVECAPAEKVKVRPMSMQPSFPNASTKSPSLYSSASSSSGRSEPPRYQAPPLTAPALNGSFPAMNMPGRCPGCFKHVSPMERDVVPGPQGTRWHSSCLICGGQEAKGRNGRRKNDMPGCGKKLDSAAKVGSEGNVWCRECMLLLSSSPTRGTLLTQTTGTGASFWSTRSDTAAPGVTRQFTGMTTIARQQTGLGQISTDPDVLRQLNTGGGLSPTRQLGYTGMASNPPVRSNFTGGGITRSYTTALNTTPSSGRMPPRPKSAGPRPATKSVDESGRGMMLMRQLTGGTGSFHSNEI